MRNWEKKGIICLLSIMVGCSLLLSGGVLGMLFFLGGPAAFTQIPVIAYKTLDDFVLVAVPLYILMSEILLKGKVGNGLFELGSKWLGHLPGGIYTGLFTPTEAAAVGTFYSLIITFFVYCTVKLRDMGEILQDTVKTTSMIFAIMIGAMLFGFILTALQAPQALMSLVTNAQVSRWIIFIGINLVLLALGSVPFAIIMALEIVLLCFAPQLATWLPSVLQ